MHTRAYVQLCHSVWMTAREFVRVNVQSCQELCVVDCRKRFSKSPGVSIGPARISPTTSRRRLCAHRSSSALLGTLCCSSARPRTCRTSMSHPLCHRMHTLLPRVCSAWLPLAAAPALHTLPYVHRAPRPLAHTPCCSTWPLLTETLGMFGIQG